MSDSDWESNGICSPSRIIIAYGVYIEASDEDTELDSSIAVNQITEIVQKITNRIRQRHFLTILIEDALPSHLPRNTTTNNIGS